MIAKVLQRRQAMRQAIGKMRRHSPNWILEAYKKEPRLMYIGWLNKMLYIPLFYGILLMLLQNNREWLALFIGWTDPWLNSRVAEYTPAVKKMLEGLSAQGDYHLMPFVSHVYFMTIVFTAIFILIYFVYLCLLFTRAHPIRQKRWIAMRLYDGRNYKNLIMISIIGIYLGIFAVWKFYYIGLLNEDGYFKITHRIKIMLHYADWISVFVLAVVPTGGLIACAYIAVAYNSAKVVMLHKCREIKNYRRREK